MSKTCDATRLTSIYVLKDPRFDTIRYVGKTIKSLEHRLNQHISDSIRKPQRHVARWINSLIRLNLTPTIIKIECCTWKESQEREIFYIHLLKSQGVRLTNLTSGGEGTLGRITLEATKIKRQLTWEGKAKPVYQYALSGELLNEYKSAKEAALLNGFRYSNIVQCCIKNKQSHKSFIWSFEKVSSLPYVRLPVSNKLLRKIDCYNLNNEFIKTFNSFGEAAKELGVDDPNIHKVIRGVYKQTKGYIFKLHGN